MKRTYLQESTTDEKIFVIVKKSDFFLKYLNLVKDFDFIRKEANTNNIPDYLIGRIITVGMLIEKLLTKGKLDEGVN